MRPIGGQLADEGDVEVERLDDVPAHRLVEDLAGQPRIAGGERSEREVAALAFGDVVAVADKADEGAIRIAARATLIGDPPITAIDMAQAVLHAERFAIHEGLLPGAQAGLEVVRMNIGSPALALGLFQRAAGELQPGIVEIVAPALGIGGPDQCRLAVRQLAEMTLALLQRATRGLAILLGAERDDHARAGGQHRLQLDDQGLAIALRRVREAHHPDQLSAVEQRQSEEGAQLGMARRHPPAARVVLGRIADHRRGGAHHRAEQGIEVVELEAAGTHALEQAARLGAPGDVAEAVHAQEGRPRLVMQHLADEAVFAARKRYELVEHRREGLRGRAPHEHAALQRGKHREHLCLALHGALKLGELGERAGDGWRCRHLPLSRAGTLLSRRLDPQDRHPISSNPQAHQARILTGSSLVWHESNTWMHKKGRRP
ncbi:hypothetical protein MASR2M50_20080 [Thauera sp.]